MIRISVPDNNDNLINIVLEGKEYKLKISYNAEGDYWSLGVYNNNGMPIIAQMKMIPRFPLNRYFAREDMPQGVFA